MKAPAKATPGFESIKQTGVICMSSSTAADCKSVRKCQFCLYCQLPGLAAYFTAKSSLIFHQQLYPAYIAPLLRVEAPDRQFLFRDHLIRRRISVF